MPFKFQLQKLMDIMEMQEKRIDARVLECTARRNAEQDALDEMSTRRHAAQKGLSASMAAGATGDVAASNDYIQLLGLKVDAQAKQVQMAQQTLDAVLLEQQKARREREKFEKLKQKKFEEWLLQEKKREAQRTDEMAGTIFMKQRAIAEEERLIELERLEKLQKLQLLRQLREKQTP